MAEFVGDLRAYNVTPHVAQNTTNRRSAIDGRTTRHAGYAVSGRMRKRIEEVFGWTKGAAGFRKTHHRGLARVGWMFTLTATVVDRPSVWWRFTQLSLSPVWALCRLCRLLRNEHHPAGEDVAARRLSV